MNPPEGLIRQIIREELAAFFSGEPIADPTPAPAVGSFLARRQATLDELAKKQAKKKKVARG